MSTHASGCAIAPLDGRGIRRGVAQAVEHLMDTSSGAVCIADFDLNHPAALPMFDDLNVSQRARNAIAQVGEATSAPLSARSIRLPEQFGKQTGVAGLPISQQHKLVAVGKTTGSIAQQATDQRLISLTLEMRDHELAHRVDEFCFPQRLSLVVRIPISLIRLKGLHLQVLDSLVMEGFPMLAHFRSEE